MIGNLNKVIGGEYESHADGIESVPLMEGFVREPVPHGWMQNGLESAWVGDTFTGPPFPIAPFCQPCRNASPKEPPVPSANCPSSKLQKFPRANLIMPSRPKSQSFGYGLRGRGSRGKSDPSGFINNEKLWIFGILPPRTEENRIFTADHLLRNNFLSGFYAFYSPSVPPRKRRFSRGFFLPAIKIRSWCRLSGRLLRFLNAIRVPSSVPNRSRAHAGQHHPTQLSQQNSLRIRQSCKTFKLFILKMGFRYHLREYYN